MNYTGILKDNIIILEQKLNLPDGTRVSLTISSKERLLKHAGVLTGEEGEELERIVKEGKTYSKKEVNL